MGMMEYLFLKGKHKICLLRKLAVLTEDSCYFTKFEFHNIVITLLPSSKRNFLNAVSSNWYGMKLYA